MAEASRRRRLSVMEIGGSADGGTESRGGDRQLMETLETQTALDLAQQAPKAGSNRRGSIMAASLEKVAVPSFTAKQAQQVGDQLDMSRSDFAYTCRKGLKPESPNQDTWFAIKLPDDYSLYGVLDGHGAAGHDVSNFAMETLPKLIIQDERFRNRTDLHGCLRDAFATMQSLIVTSDELKRMDAGLSGSTATVVIHDHKSDELTFAHVGDCTAMIAQQGPSGIGSLTMCRDHKPDLPDEKARIEAAGGRVVHDGYANYRVYAARGNYPGMNMSRAFGDLLGHTRAGISACPEVRTRRVGSEDTVLIICSDGVWEFIKPSEAAKMVADHGLSAANGPRAAEGLAKEAWDRWIREEGGEVVDDITVLLVYLNASGKRRSPGDSAEERCSDFAHDGAVVVPSGMCFPWFCCG